MPTLTTRAMTRATLAALALCALLPLAAPAQQPQRPPQGPRAMPSTRATTEVQLTHRRIGSQWFQTGAAGGPIRIGIDYGQPHLRGRQLDAVVPLDSIWRLGANRATHLVTDVDITIGGQIVPRGTYTLFAQRTGAGWRLVISRQTGHWGTEYDATADVGRVPLRARTLAESVESLSIYLVPAAEQAAGDLPRGELRIAWGTVELSTEWRVSH